VRGTASPAAPTVAGRTAGAVARRATARASTASHASAPMPHTVPKRVSSTAPISPNPSQNVVPAAVAAWSGRAASAVASPSPAAAISSRRQRAANASDAESQAPPGVASATSAGSQTSSSTATEPTASAIAPNWSARVVANATDVTGPLPSPSSSWPTVTPDVAAPFPTLNTNPPDTGCESAEITR
jgi:hypothetical protein